MIRHSRSLPGEASTEQLVQAESEVRAHLSAVAATDDDPDTNADDVRVWSEDDDDGYIKIVGELDAEPDAPYLRDDFDPDADTEFEFVRYSEEGQE